MCSIFTSHPVSRSLTLSMTLTSFNWKNMLHIYWFTLPPKHFLFQITVKMQYNYFGRVDYLSTRGATCITRHLNCNSVPAWVIVSPPLLWAWCLSITHVLMACAYAVCVSHMFVCLFFHLHENVFHQKRCYQRKLPEIRSLWTKHSWKLTLAKLRVNAVFPT